MGPLGTTKGQDTGHQVHSESENETKITAWTSAPKIPRVCAHASPICTDMTLFPDSSSFLLNLVEVSCDLVSLCFGNMVENGSYHRILGDGKADWPRGCIPRNRRLGSGCRIVLSSGDVLKQSYCGES